MGFFFPLYLLGAFAVALPLWLHLLRQHRRTPLPFSSVMFFEPRMQSSVKQRRLRYLLLLSLRIALLLFVVLAFAGPFINRKLTTPTGRKLAIIAIDRSFSMRYGHRMEEAKRRAEQELGRLHGNTLGEVLAVDSHVEALTTPTLDRSALRSAIESIEPDDLASSFGQFVRALRVQEQTSAMWLDVHFVSDMQQTGMPRRFQDLQVGGRTNLQLFSVAAAKAPNWAVETVNASTNVYDPKKTRATATISGWQTNAAMKKAALIMDGKQIASKDVNVPANGRAQVEFVGFDVPYGMHRAEVRIEPHDDLPDDDEFPFSIERSDPQKVLFLSASGKVRDAALYYRAAMEAAQDAGLLIQTETMQQASSEDLSRYAYIVLNDVGALDQTLEENVTAYVRKGGALLIALGPRSAEIARVPVTGDEFTITHQAQGADAVTNQAIPLRGVVDFKNVQFFETAHLTPKPEARVLVNLADRSPLLVEERVDDGRVLIFASGLDNVTNDFPLHASFVPFVVQTGHYLAGNEERTRTLVAGSDVELRGTNDRGAAASVIGPDGKNELSLREAAAALTFPLRRDGFYEVQRAHVPRELVAVHADRRESDLTPVPEQTLTLWRNMGKPEATPQNGVEQTVQPWNLWRYALLVALAMALAESIVANRYLLKGRQPG